MPVPRCSEAWIGTVRIMLAAAAQSGTEEKLTAALYFRVDDILRSAVALTGRGVSFERGVHLAASLADHDLYMAFFRDPDRHLLALMSEQAKRA